MTMIKKLLVLVCAIILSCGSFAQTLTFLEGDNLTLLYSLSKNGKWAFSALKDAVNYYDVSADKMVCYEGYFADDVSDNGMLAGAKLTGGLPRAAYLEAGEWKLLPHWEGFEVLSSNARGISADGKYIVGSLAKEVKKSSLRRERIPCIWTRQADGTYLVELLPYMEKDHTSRTAQANDALRCSATGDVIAGRHISHTGSQMAMCWKKGKDNQWEYHMVGKNVSWKEGVEIPAIPEVPNMPKPIEYFTKEDSVKYQADVNAYKAGTIAVDPASHAQDYMTHPDSIARYNQDGTHYNEVAADAAEKSKLLNGLTTGWNTDMSWTVLSSNGKYYTATCSGGGRADRKSVPVYFELETGKIVWFEEVTKDAMAAGITDAGDLFYSEPHLVPIRNTFVVPAGTKKKMNLVEWVKQGTDGKLDIEPHFLFTINGVENTLFVGDVLPSADGKVLLGTGYVPDGIMTYFIDMNLLDNINNTDVTSETAVYPNPATDMLYLKGNVEKASVIDLAGRTVYESSSVSGSIPVSYLGKGTYLVRLSANGETTTHKIVVTD